MILGRVSRQSDSTARSRKRNVPGKTDKKSKKISGN
jgi:hypothetical protein